MTVLVIGATGNIGPHVVDGLLERGADVRVLARDGARARKLLPGQVDVREGDPGDDDVVVAAADGVDAVFLLTAHDHEMADLQLRIIRALRRTGARIVKLSGTSSAITPDGPFTCRQHWEVEQVLGAAGVPHVCIRPNAMMQTLIGAVALPAIEASGKLPNAIGEAGISCIDARDVGEVCAIALLDPAYDGQTLVLTGAEAVTFPEVASMLAKVTGRDVPVIEITPADVRAGLLGRGMAEWEAEHFEEMYQLFRDGESEFVTDDTERILGRAPRTLEQYLDDSVG